MFDLDPQGEEDEGANIDLDAQRQGKCAVIKTSTRQVKTLFSGLFSTIDLISDVFFTSHRSSRS